MSKTISEKNAYDQQNNNDSTTKPFSNFVKEVDNIKSKNRRTFFLMHCQGKKCRIVKLNQLLQDPKSKIIYEGIFTTMNASCQEVVINSVTEIHQDFQTVIYFFNHSIKGVEKVVQYHGAVKFQMKEIELNFENYNISKEGMQQIREVKQIVKESQKNGKQKQIKEKEVQDNREEENIWMNLNIDIDKQISDKLQKVDSKKGQNLQKQQSDKSGKAKKGEKRSTQLHKQNSSHISDDQSYQQEVLGQIKEFQSNRLEENKAYPKYQPKNREEPIKKQYSDKYNKDSRYDKQNYKMSTIENNDIQLKKGESQKYRVKQTNEILDPQPLDPQPKLNIDKLDLKQTLIQTLGAQNDNLQPKQGQRKESQFTSGMYEEGRSRTNSMITGGTTKAIENLNLDGPTMSKEDYEKVIFHLYHLVPQIQERDDHGRQETINRFLQRRTKEV